MPSIPLITAEAFHRPRRARDEQHSAAERIVKRFWPQGIDPFTPGPVAGVPLDDLGEPIGEEVLAYAEANVNRWIVRCPFCTEGVQYASDQDRRFFCVSCLNLAAGGCWVRVEWPAERDAIEEALMRRPLENRNWTVGQTIDDLVAEQQAQQAPDEEEEP